MGSSCPFQTAELLHFNSLVGHLPLQLSESFCREKCLYPRFKHQALPSNLASARILPALKQRNSSAHNTCTGPKV